MLIKVTKYSNRKLYVENNGMVTVKQLSKELKAGHDLQVTCHTTGRDVTRQTLLSMLTDSEIPNTKLIELMR